MNPRSIPNASPSTFASGTTQFVVHDALAGSVCCAASDWSSLMPIRAAMKVPPEWVSPSILVPTRARLLAVEVAVLHGHGHALLHEEHPELLRHHHRAVAAAGAAHGDRQVGLALRHVAGDG